MVVGRASHELWFDEIFKHGYPRPLIEKIESTKQFIILNHHAVLEVLSEDAEGDNEYMTVLPMNNSPFGVKEDVLLKVPTNRA